MRLVAYSTIETAARSQGDLLNAQNPSTGAGSEYMQWVNDEWAEIYEKLVHSGEQYFKTIVTGTTVPGQQAYALPADFYKMRGVDVQLNGNLIWSNAHRYNFEQRNDYQLTTLGWVWPGCTLYDIEGTQLAAAVGTVTGPNLTFLPTPPGAFPYRFHYYPPAVPITATTDQMDLQNGHEKALVFGVAARAALKLRQFDFADRMIAEREKQMIRVLEDVRDMDLGEPHMIRVVRGRPAWRLWVARGWWR